MQLQAIYKPKTINDMDNPYNYSNNNPYLQIGPAHSNSYGPYCRRSTSWICDVLNMCGKRVDDVARKAEVFADNVWHQQVKLCSSFTDMAMAKISQGTKLLIEGGHDKIFHQAFGIMPGEKILKAYACHLSTSSCPVIGTLYVSTKRLAFRSDYPFSYYSSTGQQQWMYYKVAVQLDKLRAVNPSSSITNPSDKYIQLVTTDGHDFWFMGFISYEKALKQLTETLKRPPDS